MTADRFPHSPRRDPATRLLEDCAALGRLLAGTGGTAASRLADELGPELAARLVAALGTRRRDRAGALV